MLKVILSADERRAPVQAGLNQPTVNLWRKRPSAEVDIIIIAIFTIFTTTNIIIITSPSKKAKYDKRNAEDSVQLHHPVEPFSHKFTCKSNKGDWVLNQK